ncbi:hypothetical protein ABMB67_002294 [Halalkalibacter oceani]
MKRLFKSYSLYRYCFVAYNKLVNIHTLIKRGGEFYRWVLIKVVNKGGRSSGNREVEYRDYSW